MVGLEIYAQRVGLRACRVGLNYDSPSESGAPRCGSGLCWCLRKTEPGGHLNGDVAEWCVIVDRVTWINEPRRLARENIDGLPCYGGICRKIASGSDGIRLKAELILTLLRQAILVQ